MPMHNMYPFVPSFLRTYINSRNPMIDIKITQPNLMSALSTVAPAAQLNPAFPASVYCLINATENQITVHTNNGEVYISQVIPTTEITKVGRVLVEHKLLYNWAARTKPDKIIRLNIEKGVEQLHCRAGRSHIRLGTADVKSFPPNTFKSKNRYAIASKFIREGLSTTSNSRIGLPDKLDPLNAKRVINGTHFRISPTYITVEALSVAYGAFYHEAHGIDGVKETLSVVLPQKIAGILQTQLPNDESIVFVESSENNALLKIKLNETEWYTSLIAGDFPNTSQFYSEKEPVRYDMDIDSADFRNAIQTAEMFMQDATDAVLMWSVPDEDNNLSLSMKSLGNEKGNFEDKLPLPNIVEQDEDDIPFRMAGSIQQLSRISNILKSSPTVTFKVRGKENPSLFITGNQTPHTFYITKPIKVKDELWETQEPKA